MVLERVWGHGRGGYVHTCHCPHTQFKIITYTHTCSQGMQGYPFVIPTCNDYISLNLNSSSKFLL